MQLCSTDDEVDLNVTMRRYMATYIETCAKFAHNWGVEGIFWRNQSTHAKKQKMQKRKKLYNPDLECLVELPEISAFPFDDLCVNHTDNCETARQDVLLPTDINLLLLRNFHLTSCNR